MEALKRKLRGSVWRTFLTRLRQLWREWNRRHEACEGDALMTRMRWKD